MAGRPVPTQIARKRSASSCGSSSLTQSSLRSSHHSHQSHRAPAWARRVVLRATVTSGGVATIMGASAFAGGAAAVHPTVAEGERDGLELGMNLELLERVVDVVAHGGEAE